MGTVSKGHSIDRGFQAGLWVGVGVLAVSGFGYRLVAAKLADTHGAMVLPAGALAKLPFQLGEWQGKDDPLDVEVIRKTDTDDLINRQYVRRGGREAVSLYVGYGARLRDLMPHRPEVCYPGAGWSLDRIDQTTVTTESGDELPCRILKFYKGDMGAGHVTILNYYLVDGQYCSDVSLLRSKAWRFQVDMSYMAQVQIACFASTFQTRCTELVREFAAASAAGLHDCLTSAAAQAVSASLPEQGS